MVCTLSVTSILPGGGNVFLFYPATDKLISGPTCEPSELRKTELVTQSRCLQRPN